MVHSFEINGEYFAYDTENGSLHEIDKLMFALLKNDKAMLTQFAGEEITEAEEELDELRKQGVLFASAPETARISKRDGAVKALCLHVCHDCNLRCAYCFADEGTYRGEREMLSLETGKAAVDFLIKNSAGRKNLEIDFFGGEPLMNFDVLRGIVEYGNAEAAKYGKRFKFTTTTNGVLLTEEIARYLNREMDNVVLSLDGRKEINDSVRRTANGKGSFDLITDRFKYFRSIRGDKSYFVRGTFTSGNKDFAKDVLFLNDLGFDQISVEPVVLPDSHPLALRESDLPVLKAEYEALAMEYLKRRAGGNWFSFFHFVVFMENGPCYAKRIEGCGAGGEYLAVAPNGDIYPCHQFVGEKRYLLGNVHNDDFASVRQKSFSGCDAGDKEECRQCWAKQHCGGGCRANSEHLNDGNKPYFVGCELMKKRLECALYVYAKEKSRQAQGK